jgi:hypothetical protein
MPVDLAEIGAVGPGDRFPDGFYAHMLAVAEEMRAVVAADLDPRLRFDHADHLNKVEKTGVSKAAKASRLAVLDERLASLKAGEPQLIPRAGLAPDVCQGVPWLQDGPPWMSADERDCSCCMVRVFNDDRVEPGQTRAQDDERGHIVGAGYPVMRLDVATGDWIPRIQNPATGKWEDLDPSEIR